MARTAVLMVSALATMMCAATAYSMFHLPQPLFSGAEVTIGPGPIVVLAIGLLVVAWSTLQARQQPE